MAESFISRKGGSSGNAVASDLLSGKTATVSTGDITGTMTNNGTVNITPSTSNQSIAQGYHSGSGIVYGDADLVAGNIKSGVNIFGVTGNYKSGVINLSTDQNGNTSTSSNLGTLVSVVGITVGVGHNSRNSGYTTTMTVQGSSDGGSTWTNLLSASCTSPANSKAAGTNSSTSISGTYNMFRLVSSRVDSYWEFVIYGHASITYL